MPLVALVCVGLLGWGDLNPSPSDVTAGYEQAKAAAGRSSDDQVRLALWCEAHGLTAERLRHLALAVLADPANATARGLAGLVARDGRWVAADSVASAIRADGPTATLLAEYDLRRSRTRYTADNQLALARWADEHGLKDQARAHYTAVTRIDPHCEIAWHRLGYQKRGENWRTEAQIAAAHAEAEAQKQADKLWLPILQKCKTMLARPADRAEAQATLAQVTDPRAFHAIRAVFGHGHADQIVAVGLLGQIDGGAATLALANLAIHGHTPDVCDAAIDALARRDPRDCLDMLVQQLRPTYDYHIRPIQGPGTVGKLIVEGERYNLERVYAPPGGPTPPTRMTNSAMKMFDVSTARGLQNTINAGITASNLQLAQQALADDIRRVQYANERIDASNTRIRGVLARISGQDLGSDTASWVRWNIERVGYAYQSQTATTPKPTFIEMPPLDYQSQVSIPQPHTACFAAGTPVRTIDGAKAIDEVRTGDLVLTQDTVSGALSFQPVLTAFHNPPSPTYRVKLGGEQIVATGIHRFWRAGKGWVMARDLKAGDLLRVVGGVATVEEVAPERTQPVFNLEVAEGRSFFVGRAGALVHDNSPVEATPTPFDAPRVVATVATAR